MAKQNPAVIVSLAQKFVGTPYQWGGTTPQTGFDCSGFVQYLYKQVGIDIPRVTYDQVNIGTPVEKGDLRAGDIVFFEPTKQGPGHEGLYIGDGKFIEAPHTGASVRVSELAGRGDYVSARRVIPDGAPHIGNVAQVAATQPAPPPAAVPATPEPAPTAATPAPAPALAPTAPQPLPSVAPPGDPGTLELPGGGPRLPGTTPWQQQFTNPALSPETQQLIAMSGGK